MSQIGLFKKNNAVTDMFLRYLNSNLLVCLNKSPFSFSVP